MGHKVGWLTLHAGIAGGADIILVPEIPYDINKVAAAVNKRAKEGKRFSIIAVAEGAISKEQAALSKKEYKKYIATRQYPSISYEIGAKISELTGQEVRVAVPGHMQRGGSPTWRSSRQDDLRRRVWLPGRYEEQSYRKDSVSRCCRKA